MKAITAIRHGRKIGTPLATRNHRNRIMNQPRYRRFLSGEQLEPRFCLSVVAFVENTVVEPTIVHGWTVADLDKDSDADVIVANDNAISWYQNSDGLGTFVLSELARDDSSNTADWLEVADVDGDADLDLLAGGRDQSLRWFRNDGKLGFSASQVIANDQYNSAIVFDHDGDGDADILGGVLRGVFDNQSGRWHDNLGDGRFVAGDVFYGFNPEMIDIDQDQDLDLVAFMPVGEMWSEAVVSWFENVDGVLKTEGKRILDLGTISSAAQPQPSGVREWQVRVASGK